MKNVKTVVFLLLVATACTLCLGGAQLMYERAAERLKLRLYARILRMFDESAPEGRVQEVFDEHFETREIGGRTYYVTRKKMPGTRVFMASGPGLWGPIEVLLAVGPDGQELKGLRVVTQTETPGLGGRIEEPEFQEQFRGVDVEPQVRLVAFPSQPNEVDAVTGATRTSMALQEIINEGIARMNQDWQG